MTRLVPVAILNLRSKRPRVILFTILALFVVPVAQPQTADDQGLAPSMAKALIEAKVKTVVVFDFMGPGDRLSQLGQGLADGFSHTLANSGGHSTSSIATRLGLSLRKIALLPTSSAIQKLRGGSLANSTPRLSSSANYHRHLGAGWKLASRPPRPRTEKTSPVCRLPLQLQTR